ncbi:2'-5' RNA ligase family protein [Nakamurella sp. A5-74]|uniref:2'-5' RNA ligase family protein n=1 Tax=Nakamurella sp. A5-74 TaxID=3158264 RepID=A0AAU8DVH8_9ACTN
MRSIFEPLRTSWESLLGSVHVYALPGWDRTVVAPWQDAIAATEVCKVQPLEFLHATIARTPLFLPAAQRMPKSSQDGTRAALPQELAHFSAALDHIAGARPAFEVPLGRPEIMTTAVCAAGEQTQQWQTLVTEVRAAISQAFPDRPTPPGPFGPHVSLGYARLAADDAPLCAAYGVLAATPWSATLRVGALHLLSVDANEDAGTFTWSTLSVHPLN